METIKNTLIALALTPITVIAAPASSGLKTAPVRAAYQTDTVFHAKTASTAWNIKLPAFDSPPDLADALRTKALMYSEFEDGWDGEGSVAATGTCGDAALAFIDSLPGGLPLPGIMMSFSGEIGFYWDLSGGYADISFAKDGVGSFFSRSSQAQEVFIEELKQGQFTRDWFFGQLGAMAAPVLQAA